MTRVGSEIGYILCKLVSPMSRSGGEVSGSLTNAIFGKLNRDSMQATRMVYGLF